MISGGRIGVVGRVLVGIGALGAAVGLGYLLGSKRERPQKASGDKGDAGDRFANDAGVRMLDGATKELMRDKKEPAPPPLSEVGKLCIGQRCIPRSKYSINDVPLKRNEWCKCEKYEPRYYYHFNQLKYFKRYAGRGERLSWKEIQGRPFKLRVKKKPRLRATYTMSHEEFIKLAQSSKYDSDPSTLNYMEFDEYVNKVFRPMPGFGCYPVDGDDYESLPHCGEETFNGDHRGKQPQIRRIIRQGLVSALKDTWSVKKQEVWKAVNRGRLSKVTELLYSYLPVLSEMAHYGNPHIYKLCFTGCSSSLYEIEEMASPASLRVETIKVFWSDVGKIYDAVLKKAKRRGIKNVKKVVGQMRTRKVKYYDLPRDDDYGCSDYTLWQLMEKTNPDVVKRIKEWR